MNFGSTFFSLANHFHGRDFYTVLGFDNTILYKPLAKLQDMNFAITSNG